MKVTVVRSYRILYTQNLFMQYLESNRTRDIRAIVRLYQAYGYQGVIKNRNHARIVRIELPRGRIIAYLDLRHAKKKGKISFTYLVYSPS